MDPVNKSVHPVSPNASTVLGSENSGDDELHLSVESSTLSTTKPQQATELEENRSLGGAFINRMRSIRPAEVTWLILYACANALAFAQKATQYSDNPSAEAVYGRCVVAARGAAACINLNCLLILLPVCRHLITALRASKRIRRVVPVDRHLEAHVLIGTAILLFTLVHVGGQVCNAYQFSRAQEADIYALFGPRLANVPHDPGARWTYAFTSIAGVTGILMVAIMVVAYPLTLVRKRRFNVFWSSHHLLLLMLVIMCIHGTASMLEPYRSLAWTIGPLSIYVLFRLLRESSSLSRASLLNAQLKPGGVIQLRLSKPRSWGGTHVHKAGMMAMVKVPQLSALEWHPFSLTSLPSDDHLEFHIKISGDWTTHLSERLFAAGAPAPRSLPLASEADQRTDVEAPPPEYFPRSNSPGLRNEMPPSVGSNLTFLIDGPMSSAMQSWADHPAVVLVGSGIGITPAISVLRQISASSSLPTKRVYFFWMVRNAEGLQWFAHDLERLISKERRRRGGGSSRTRIRCYVTGTGTDPGNSSRTWTEGSSARMSTAVQGRTIADAPLLAHVTRAGRPNWRDELALVQADAQSAGMDCCKVYVCGSAPLAKEVSTCASSLCSATFWYDVTHENFLMA
jgi:predicted ferric reductase